MADEGKGFLALLAFLLLLLALNPSLIGTTAGSIGAQDFENVWTGFGLVGQMVAVGLVFITIIAFLVGTQKS